MKLTKNIDAATNENSPNLIVKFYNQRCILFFRQEGHDSSGQIWDISYEPYITQLAKRDLTDRDVLYQIKNDINTYCTQFEGGNQQISPNMINAVAEMIFKVIKRTTATGDIAADLSSLFFDGHFVLFMHDKFVNIGLKDFYYDDYINLMDNQTLNEDDLFDVIMNDILDFISQYSGSDDLIDSPKLKKSSRYNGNNKASAISLAPLSVPDLHQFLRELNLPLF